jgi:hypothetical protein
LRSGRSQRHVDAKEAKGLGARLLSSHRKLEFPKRLQSVMEERRAIERTLQNAPVAAPERCSVFISANSTTREPVHIISISVVFISPMRCVCNSQWPLPNRQDAPAARHITSESLKGPSLYKKTVTLAGLTMYL